MDQKLSLFSCVSLVLERFRTRSQVNFLKLFSQRYSANHFKFRLPHSNKKLEKWFGAKDKQQPFGRSICCA